MASYDNEDGVWRTIGGRRIFIKDGEDLGSAMKRSGKFKSAKKKEYLTEHEREEYKTASNERKQELDNEDEKRRIENEMPVDKEKSAKEGFNSKAAEEAKLKSERSKQYNDIEKASGLKVEKSYQTDAYGNGDEDHFELSDGRTVVHSRESLGKKEDSWSIETFKDGSLHSENFKSYDEMIDHLKGGSNNKTGNADKEISNQPYKKAFEEYKKKHPNTKLTLNKFINMSEGK